MWSNSLNLSDVLWSLTCSRCFVLFRSTGCVVTWWSIMGKRWDGELDFYSSYFNFEINQTINEWLKKVALKWPASPDIAHFKYSNSSLQRDKCEHDSWCKHSVLFSTFCAPGFLFMRHKASSSSTQQAEEALVRYNLFTSTQACLEWSFVFLEIALPWDHSFCVYNVQ